MNDRCSLTHLHTHRRPRILTITHHQRGVPAPRKASHTVPSRSRLIRGALIILVLGAAYLVVNYYVDVDQDQIEATVDGFGIWGPVAYTVVLFLGLTVPFNPISDLATVTVAAIVFHPVIAILATFVAQSLSLGVNYALARRVGPWALDRATRGGANQRVARMIGRLEDRITLRSVFLLRFVLPLTAIGIDFVSYLSGMKPLPFLRFYIVSVIPWTIMGIIFFGSAAVLREISPGLVIVPAIVLIAGTSLATLIYRRFRTRRAPSSPSAQRNDTSSRTTLP